jgi:hypothetical protein
MSIGQLLLNKINKYSTNSLAHKISVGKELIMPISFIFSM